MLAEPEVFAKLCSRLVDNLIPYLAMQVEAGADVLQVFDSWGGALDAATYRSAILPHVQRLVAGGKKLGVPVILYVNGCAQLLEVMADSGADVLGIDWRVDAADAIARVGSRVALQGNLDPCTLFAPPAVISREVTRVLDEFREQRGYIFNLGSGILPGVPVESMDTLLPRAARAPRARGGGRGAHPPPRRDAPDDDGAAREVQRPGPPVHVVSDGAGVDRLLGPADYEAACARANAKGSPVSLYVHLPFCDEQCWFCGCFMKIVPKPDRAGDSREEIEPYLADVHREIDILASRIDRSRPVKQVHWGGGTPTYLVAGAGGPARGAPPRDVPARRGRRSLRRGRPARDDAGAPRRPEATAASTACRWACRTSTPRCRSS